MTDTNKSERCPTCGQLAHLNCTPKIAQLRQQLIPPLRVWDGDERKAAFERAIDVASKCCDMWLTKEEDKIIKALEAEMKEGE